VDPVPWGQAVSWVGRVFTLPVEVHGWLLAVLSTVTSGPTVVTRQIPTLFVAGPVATAHHTLGLVHPCCPSHEILHWWHCKCGLPAQDGVWSHAATIGGMHDREGGAAAILLCADIAVAAHGAKGKEGEGKHGRPGEGVLEVVGVADSQATGATAAAAPTGSAHDAAGRRRRGLWGRRGLLMVVVVVVALT
jgi:hypothetical protein